MTIVLIDIFCAILFVVGVTVAFKGARARGDGEGGSPPPATYATRIAGTMMAFFALAFATLVTVFTVWSR